uniref:L1 transposable element RRM domain-containing protein n=1 Tax=Latimeria chalumnae TaxID=7897 RepID=H2ZUE0_LATCH
NSEKKKLKEKPIKLHTVTNMAAAPLSEGEQKTQIMRELRQLESLLHSMATDITDIRGAISDIREDLSGLSNQIVEAEGRVSTLEDEQATWGQRLQEVEREQERQTVTAGALWDKLQDLENRSRCDNIRVLGVPEGEEREAGSGPEFLKCLLINCFDLSESDPMEIERAHRSLGPRPGPNQCLRPIIAQFLRFQDREQMLRLAREAGEVHWRGERLMFFLDLSKE